MQDLVKEESWFQKNKQKVVLAVVVAVLVALLAIAIYADVAGTMQLR